jgi:hypothetical protein
LADKTLIASVLDRVWDNAVGVAAVLALALGVWISARTLGLLARPKFWLRSTYLPPRDAIGFFAMPHFLIEYENRGNVPITFSDFMLALPRLEGVIDAKYGFVDHPGAKMFIDKRETSTLATAQEFKAMDFRTNKVRLEPGDSHTDFFDLEAFLPEAKQSDSFRVENVPNDFKPILTFHDSYGNVFWADEDGLRAGYYVYPHEAAMLEGRKRVRRVGILTTRRFGRWFGWSQEASFGLGEKGSEDEAGASA